MPAAAVSQSLTRTDRLLQAVNRVAQREGKQIRLYIGYVFE
jgi:hypothetical protein